MCRRLIDKIWLGGDWSLLELKRFYRASWSTTEFYDYICARHPTAGGKGKGGGTVESPEGQKEGVAQSKKRNHRSGKSAEDKAKGRDKAHHLLILDTSSSERHSLLCSDY